MYYVFVYLYTKRTQEQNHPRERSSFTREVVKRRGHVLGGIPVGGVAHHQAGFPHGSVPHQHALHPPLRRSGPRRPRSGPPRPAAAPDPPRWDGRRGGHRGRLVASVAPQRHLARGGGGHVAGVDPGKEVQSRRGPVFTPSILPFLSAGFRERVVAAVRFLLVSIVRSLEV